MAIMDHIGSFVVCWQFFARTLPSGPTSSTKSPPLPEGRSEVAIRYLSNAECANRICAPGHHRNFVEIRIEHGAAARSAITQRNTDWVPSLLSPLIQESSDIDRSSACYPAPALDGR